jgi:hypothetical protein
MTPTSSRTCGRARKDASTGTMMVEVPNPVMVPTALASRVRTAMRTMSIRDDLRVTREIGPVALSLDAGISHGRAISPGAAGPTG